MILLDDVAQILASSQPGEVPQSGSPSRAAGPLWPVDTCDYSSNDQNDAFQRLTANPPLARLDPADFDVMGRRSGSPPTVFGLLVDFRLLGSAAPLA